MPTKKEIIASIIITYECTKKEANEWYKGYIDERNQLIVDGVRQNAKKYFKED